MQYNGVGSIQGQHIDQKARPLCMLLMIRDPFSDLSFKKAILKTQCTELRLGGKTFSLFHDPNNVGLILVERLLFFPNSDYHMKRNFLFYGLYFLDNRAILLRD